VLDVDVSLLAPCASGGDFCSGAARSIWLVGGCLAELGFSGGDLSGGVARSICAVGACFLAFLSF
jgi:hypothetical protein